MPSRERSYLSNVRKRAKIMKLRRAGYSQEAITSRLMANSERRTQIHEAEATEQRDARLASVSAGSPNLCSKNESLMPLATSLESDTQISESETAEGREQRLVTRRSCQASAREGESTLRIR